MRAVNIYAMTRKVQSDVKPLFEKALSHREEKLRIKEQEFDQISQIVEELQKAGAGEDCFEDWFYSFTIPHISREFDLLKAGRNGCVVNVELKSVSPSVTQARIKKQLERNAYYLSLIGKRIYSFTYVSDGRRRGKLYALSRDGIRVCTFRELIRRLGMVKQSFREGIEDLFRPGDFLISPFSEPERFCNGQYFLTEHQQQMKEKVLSGIRRSTATLWGITGEAGTGKTLLLYDVAKSLSGDYRICVIHCGKLSEGHERLKNMLEGIDVIEAGDARIGTLCSAESTDDYDVVCVDETQRLSQEELEIVLEAYGSGRIKACLFVYDLKQVLSKSERSRNNPERLHQILNFQELRLAKTIRTSKEIYAFINAMLDLKKHSNLSFPNIDVLWAGNEREKEQLVAVCQRRGYRYIPPEYEDSHDVIGLEFDRVQVVLDQRFYYDEAGILLGEESPDADYLYVQLLYQNVSRAKERLCVIVQENAPVFRELVTVVNRNS